MKLATQGLILSCMAWTIVVVGCQQSTTTTDTAASTTSTSVADNVVVDKTIVRNGQREQITSRLEYESLLADEIGKRIDIEQRRNNSTYTVERVALMLVRDDAYAGYIVFKSNTGATFQSKLDVTTKVSHDNEYTYTYDKP